jgi:acetyltransferase-like isoleucine patch superfamily enzyme
MTALRRMLAGVAVLQSILSTRFWSLVAYVRLRAHGAAVGRGLKVRGPIRLHCHRTGSIRVGDHCRILSGFAGNPVGGVARMAIWVGPGGRLQLGNRVGLSNSTIVCMRAVSIEDEVLLGGGSQVFDTDFHPLDAEERTRSPHPRPRTAPVTIGRRAFVGGHSILLKGSVVGEGAVLGAGSVLRSRVPDGQVWAGNPARFLRRLDGAPQAARPRMVSAEEAEEAAR